MGKREKGRGKVDTGGGDSLSLGNAFEALDALDRSDLSQAQPVSSPPSDRTSRRTRRASGPPNRGRVELRRVKSGRGGKEVTEISGFIGLSDTQIEDLGRTLRKHCGVGGTTKNRCVELQGDHRDVAEKWLANQGFRPVRTGG